MIDHVGRLIEGWRRERPDLDVAPIGVVNRIIRLAAFFSYEVEAVFARAGVTYADFLVLANLRRAGPPYQSTQRDLMDSLRLTSGTISVRIDRLVDAGLVRREPDPRDGRNALVTLIGTGAAFFDRLAPEHLSNESRLLAALPLEEHEGLARMLQTLLIEFEQPTTGRPDHRIGLTVVAAHEGLAQRAAVGLPPTRGLLIQSVLPNTPAADAGLAAGDLIQRAAGFDVYSLADLSRAFDAGPRAVELGILRGAKTIRVRVTPLPAGNTDEQAPPRRRRR